ncbi:MAG TPA: cytochrome c oxidase subunit II [Planctomycetota bacterium]|nr:cytochrome c oxidase subunit II [Planctomycetota bacterium]
MNAVTGLINSILLPLAAAAPEQWKEASGGSFWFPPQGSSFARGIDSLFYFILIVSAIFFVIIIAVTLACLAKYTRKPGVRADVTFTHSNFLELAWTIIPSLLLIPMFWYGFTGFLEVHSPPKDCYEISVTAKKWSWEFSYPNGAVNPELHVPIGVPVKLTLESQDVLHSLFIPAFRIKRDAVPGRYTTIWFQATRMPRPGEYFQIYCAEYCGTSHSEMLAKCFVHEKSDFDKWVTDAADIDKLKPTLTPVQKGEYLFGAKGCTQCHSVNPAKPNPLAPNLKGIWGKQEQLADGSSVTVEDNYIKESLLEPMAKVVKGYQPIMPTQKGKITEKEIGYIRDYIKSLGE